MGNIKIEMHAYPKIFAVGTVKGPQILGKEVEITEKIDGSQFVFAKIEGVLQARSKGALINLDNPPKLFKEAVETIQTLEKRGWINNNKVYYCEYLQKPKHNTIKYDKVPFNHLALFGCKDKEGFYDYASIKYEAIYLGCDVVPLLHQGTITEQAIINLLETDSYLGGSKIEGVVIKCYEPFMYGNIPFPISCLKYVSEKFRESNQKSWKERKANEGIEGYLKSLGTTARWEKAYQHLRETEQLEYATKDIGSLISEVIKDVIEEEKENLMSLLWKKYERQLKGSVVKGLPEWYKNKLMNDAFKEAK